ncbi:hypothetical protein VTK73DRAFT_1360 [Phialemonium thermophilum]|uniref:Carboxylesterase type B domain-containing protein n=1 Tax=Phialemonium thermophilum TaxID=223376 RepID=A0ABR3VTL1_9PEZI
MKQTLPGSFVAAAILAVVSQVAAAPTPAQVLEERAAKVTVPLAPSSTVVGSSLLGVETFRGIPYALPPTGPLRLKPPVRLNTSLGTFDATRPDPTCPQMLFSNAGGNLITDFLGEVLDTPLFQTLQERSYPSCSGSLAVASR